MRAAPRTTSRAAHRRKTLPSPRAILSGEKGHKRNAVLMNAGAALYIGGKAESMKDGIALAAELIDSGKALETLERFITVSNRAEANA